MVTKTHGMNGYSALRWFVLERDNFTCQYCGQSAPNVALEVDHIVPVAEGGEDSPDNLKTSCYSCNRGKEHLKVRLKSGRPVAVKPLTRHIPSKLTIRGFLEDNKTSVFSAEHIAITLGYTIDGVRATLSRLHKKGKVTQLGRSQWQIVS